MSIKKTNIRATSLKEFWGTKYDKSMYLFVGALRANSLKGIEEINNIYPDPFLEIELKNNAVDYCQNIYYKLIPKLSKTLNKIHNKNFSNQFWEISFGYWLYRHISVAYDKYIILSKIDIDNTSIKLLHRSSFFIPNNHYEYVSCFASDFGVQQLVSQYYYLFSKKKFDELKTIKFVVTNKKKAPAVKNIKGLIKDILYFILSKSIQPKVVLLNAFYRNPVKKRLLLKSKGRIQQITLPSVNINVETVDFIKRKLLIDIIADNNFERFLSQTLYYCLPRIFVEHFNNYYSVYQEQLMSQKFSTIFSEGWIGISETSLYCAIGCEVGKKFVSVEHAAGRCLVENSTLWIDSRISDIILTTGWEKDEPKFIQGGFDKQTPKYNSKNSNKNILFIGHTVSIYLLEYSSHSYNSGYLEELKPINSLIKELPVKLKKNFVYRPRLAANCWNSEILLNTKEVFVDKGNWNNSLLNARIVIIDHITTGLAEILKMEIPFLLLLNPRISIKEEYSSIFDNLEKSGVVHNNPATLLQHLIKIYDNVEEWWNTEIVYSSIVDLKQSYLASSDKSVKYLLSYL